MIPLTQYRTQDATPDVEAQVKSIGDGQPLPGSVRSYFEPRFGYDFSQIRVHTNNRANDLAKTINAKAFTIGKDVVFGAGCYENDKSRGIRLLAHELAHVMQQRHSRSTPDLMRQVVVGPCPDVPGAEILLQRGMTHPSVRTAQRKLNAYHTNEITAGRPGLADAPLIEDCIFGNRTFNSVYSFQQQVFPGQFKEHDGIVGDHTWAALNRTTPGGLATPPIQQADPDRTIMDTANAQSRNILIAAILLLSSLEFFVRSNLPLLPEHQQTIDAVRDQLFIQPNDPNYLNVIRDAMNLMNKNLTTKTQIVSERHSLFSRCGPSDWAYSYIGYPPLNIHCCEMFFSVASPACRRDLITHEYFHTIGLVHKNVARPLRPWQALQEVHQMTCLTAQIVTGIPDICKAS